MFYSEESSVFPSLMALKIHQNDLTQGQDKEEGKAKCPEGFL